MYSPLPETKNDKTQINSVKREKFRQLKQNNLINAKNYELDKETLKEYYPYYESPEKPENLYNIVEKKTIFYKKIENSDEIEIDSTKEYYSNYKSFREYLSTGKNYNYTINELQKVKSLLTFSKQLRTEISNKFNIPLPNDDNDKSIRLPSEKTEEDLTNFFNLSNLNFNSNPKGQKRVSAIFNRVKQANNKNFIEKCILLKEKKKDFEDKENKYMFRLFSKFEKDSDIYNFPKFNGFNNNIFYNQNRKLSKLYYLENKFINIADLKNRNLPSLIQSKLNIDGLSKTKISKFPYIQAFFYGRDIDYFKEMDNFVGIYRYNSLQNKNNEKELFNSLYDVLTRCNSDCSNFMRYLYSKSNMFKYIYDIFTIENKLDIMDKENVPIIEKDFFNEPFLNDSLRQYFSTSNIEFQPSQNKNTIPTEKIDGELLKEEENNFIDNFRDYFGNNIMDKICFYENQLTKLLENKEKNIKTLLSLFKEIQYDYFLIVNNEEQLYIVNPNDVDSKKKDVKLINENIKSLKFFIIDEKDCDNDSFESNDINLSEEKIVIIKINFRKNLLTKEQNKDITDEYYICKIKIETLKKLEQREKNLLLTFNEDILNEIKIENEIKNDIEIKSEKEEKSDNQSSSTNTINKVSLNDLNKIIQKSEIKEKENSNSKSESFSSSTSEKKSEESSEEDVNKKAGNNSILKFIRKQVKNKSINQKDNKKELFKISLFNNSKFSDNLMSDEN